MHTKTVNRPIVSALMLGAFAWLGGCESSARDPLGQDSSAGAGGDESSSAGDTGGLHATGGRSETGGVADTGGTVEAGGGADTGGTTDAAGMGGAECQPRGDDSVVWTAQDGAGGEGGASGPTHMLCSPGGVCFAPAVPVAGLSFVHHAFAILGATADAEPVATNETGLPTVTVTSPEPGKVCMRGDDGAGLNLRVGSGVPWEGPDVSSSAPGADFRAGSLGIAALSFVVETPLEARIVVRTISFPPPCGDIVVSEAEQDGSSFFIGESGSFTRLSLATDFWPAVDTNEISDLNFWAGDGPYDYCIRDLEFLDGDGNEVVP